MFWVVIFGMSCDFVVDVDDKFDFLLMVMVDILVLLRLFSLIFFVYYCVNGVVVKFFVGVF